MHINEYYTMNTVDKQFKILDLIKPNVRRNKCKNENYNRREIL